MQNAAARVFFLLGFDFFFCFAIAQQKMGPYIGYGPEAKYFSNLNYSVYQSKNGYLWVGTSSGLIRFDGKRYKNYFANYTNPNSPSDNSSFDITEDKNGNLWFAGFYHGATRYNQRTGVFKKYPSLSKDSNPYYGIYRIVNDTEGGLWFATAGRGLAKYDFAKDTFDFYYPHPDKPTDGTARGYNYVTDIVQDRKNKNILWVSTFYGLFCFDKTTRKFTYYYSGLTVCEFSDMLINDMEEDKDGLLWLGTYNDWLHCFDTKEKKFLPNKAKKFSKIVYDLKLVDDSTLYAACLNEGLFQLNIRTGVFANITPPRNPVDPTALLPSIQKVSITPDAGTFIGGNYYVYQRHSDFVRLKKNISPPQRLPGIGGLNTFIWDPKRQLYWISTYGGNGLYMLDRSFLHLKPITFPAQKEHRTNYTFKNLTVDAFDRVWVLNDKNIIHQWNDREEMFNKPLFPVPLPDSVIKKTWKLNSSSEGNIWMMSGENFIYWDIRENKTEKYQLTWNSAYKGLHNIGLGELKIDPDGNAWLLTESGMFYCNRQQKKVTHIFETGTGKSDRLSAIVLAGAFNKYNDLWITSGNGIQVIDRKSFSVLANHDIEGGLPSMLVNSINTDTAGRIWAGTTSGLGLFNPKNKTWRLFNRLDGLERDYLDGEIFITSNNKIVIDQVNGFLIKDIDELVFDTRPPILHLTSIRINNEEYADSVLPEFTNQLVLRHNQNNIDIEFAAMDWVYPFKTFYYSWIEGISSEGAFSSDHQDCKISLAGLQPGKYVLHIKALNGNGAFSKEIIFPIMIKPPFWRTWWFIGICICLLGIMIYALYRYRINRIVEMQNLRNNISQDLHDDIGASLSNINILNELARRNILQPGKSEEYLSKASEDVQRISESLSDIVWNINPKYDAPEKLFIRMKRYVADMLDGKNINGEFDFPENAMGLTLSMTKRRDLYLIFKEAVNNLVKYSEAKNAIVKITVSDQRVILLVKDDGKGFDRKNARIGNGLHNMEQRAQSAGAVLSIHSEPGMGTTVRLEMKSG